MEEDRIEDDTYSLILTSLRHPLRRKILRMLSDGPHGFSQILESLSIDSGHLNYHIKCLGDLVTRAEDGKYMLSTAGWAAIKLMGNVEEHEESAEINKRRRRTSKTALVFSVLFAVALIIMTIYLLTYTTQNQGILFEVHQEGENLPMIVQPNQQFNYTFSIGLTAFGDTIGYSIGPDKTMISIPKPTNDIVQWTRYFSETRLIVNGTYAINVAVYDPSNRIVVDHREDGDISSPQIILPSFEFSEFGDYTLRVNNLREGNFNATLVPYGVYVRYLRPLFQYGIFGVIILVLYPIFLFLSWNLGNKTKKRESRRSLTGATR